MDKTLVRYIRASRPVVETARIELGSSNRKELADPDCLPVVNLYAVVLDYADKNWQTGVSQGTVRRKRKLVWTESGLTWQGVPFHPANEDEIVTLVRAA